METLRTLARCAFLPWEGFPLLAVEGRTLGGSLMRMLLWRSPVVFLAGWLGVLQYLGFQELLLRGTLPGPPWLTADLDPTALQEVARALPSLPQGGTLLAWGLLLAPLSVLSLWAHHVVWDHASLWLLGCRNLKVRATAQAEADAVWVGALGAALALLGDLPGVGCALQLLLAPIGTWFWVMRGFALAAWHEVPLWKGLVATLVHAVAAVLAMVLLGVAAWFLALAMV